VPQQEDLAARLQRETRSESADRRPAAPALVPGLTILYHPDVSRVGERVALTGLAAGRPEPLGRGVPLFSPPGGPQLAPLGDVHLSRSHIHLVPGSTRGGVRIDRADSRTTVEADGMPVAAERELSDLEVERGVVLLLADRVVLLLHALDPLGDPGDLPGAELLGTSAAMVRLRREIARAAALEVPVLLRGETGTGKELAARALHAAGPRAGRPFVAVNLAAVPPSLAAADLFGAARGAYTGADRRREGFFGLAHGGTLFLDEVGETPLEVQPLLLRALEQREIQPVGGEEPRIVDVRLIAAADAPLEEAVAAGRFRAPLLHRLAGYEIRVPALAARREDFGLLLVHFVAQELAEMGFAGRLEAQAEARPWLPARLVAALALLPWPGNVRQLRNAARRIAIAGLYEPEVPAAVVLESLATPPGIAGAAGAASVLHALPPPRPRRSYRRPEEVSDEELLAALRDNRWRLQPTAARLGISRTSLYDRIERSSNLRKAADLPREEIALCSTRCAGDLDAMVEILEVSKRGLQRRMKRLGLA